MSSCVLHGIASHVGSGCSIKLDCSVSLGGIELHQCWPEPGQRQQVALALPANTESYKQRQNFACCLLFKNSLPVI